MEINRQEEKLTKDQKFELRLNYRKWEFDANPTTGEIVDYWFKEIESLLSTQEEKIFKQLETIDVKMGDPDAEAKVKFAIKAMIRHIKLKNATK